MSVYVDNPIYNYGRMKMCHLIADTHEELLNMVDLIGVDRKWIQYPGEDKEHFDICKSKRLLAIQNGAIPIASKELIKLIQAKRANRL